jgi:hypothetical protein
MPAGLRACERCDRAAVPTIHASQPEGQCSVTFVLAYRCRAASGSLRSPFVLSLGSETSIPPVCLVTTRLSTALYVAVAVPGGAPDQIIPIETSCDARCKGLTIGSSEVARLGPNREAGGIPARSRRCIRGRLSRHHCPMGGKARGEDDPGARRPALGIVSSILRGREPMAGAGHFRAFLATGYGRENARYSRYFG